jgi:hypothetical protein
VVAEVVLDALENGQEEVLADDQSRFVNRTLSTDDGYYLNPPELARVWVVRALIEVTPVCGGKEI